MLAGRRRVHKSPLHSEPAERCGLGPGRLEAHPPKGAQQGLGREVTGSLAGRGSSSAGAGFQQHQARGGPGLLGRARRAGDRDSGGVVPASRSGERWVTVCLQPRLGDRQQLPHLGRLLDGVHNVRPGGQGLERQASRPAMNDHWDTEGPLPLPRIHGGPDSPALGAQDSPRRPFPGKSGGEKTQKPQLTRGR